MTFAATRIGMPLADFIEAFERQPFEIINGERRPKLPNVFGHSETSQTLFLALHLYAAANQAGSAVIETTFVLPNGDDPDWVSGSRIPDVMFFAGDRLAQYKARTPDYRSRPIALVPDLVVEVISPGDRYSEVDEKIEAYLQDGVRLLWVVDPQRRKVMVYTPDQEYPLTLKGDAVLEGGDVLPGFRLPLPQLFA